MAKNTIIELNGRAFDARSGAMLGEVPRITYTANVQQMHPQPVPKPGANSMDGMVQSSRLRTPLAVPGNHVAAHHPQPTKTLMRHAVKPPQALKLDHAKLNASGLQTHATVQHVSPAQPVVTPKLSSRTIDHQRAMRARYADRSRTVEHFRPTHHQSSHPQLQHQSSTTSPIVAPAAVTVAPQNTQSESQSYSKIPIITPEQMAASQPVASPAAPVHKQSNREIAAARRPYAQHQARQATLQRRQPSIIEQPDDDHDMFMKALASADSHEQTAPHEKLKTKVKRKASKGRRVIAAFASLALFAVMCGFVAYQNRTQIQLQIASAKAGFAATTPMYTPEGYNIGKLAYASGNIAANFSAPGKQPYSITQKKSNWDSQTLLENFVATTDEEYRGFQSNGRTVYVYGKGNATWVNGGIWYQIKDAKDLTDEQLVKIAASM